MRTLIYSIAGVVALLASSCDQNAKLASEVNGSWGLTNQTLDVGGAFSSTINSEEYLFTLSASGAKDGLLEISSMIEMELMSPFNGNVVESLQNNVAASASISGKWQVVDDDEILLNLDLSSLSVDIDTTAVSLNSNLMTGTDSAVTGTLDASQINTCRMALISSLRARYGTMRKLSDVKVKDKGAYLKFEVGDVDYILNRLR